LSFLIYYLDPKGYEIYTFVISSGTRTYLSIAPPQDLVITKHRKACICTEHSKRVWPWTAKW